MTSFGLGIGLQYLSGIIGGAVTSFIINLITATSTRSTGTTGITDGLLVTYPANTPSFNEGDLQNYDAGTNHLLFSLTPASQITASLATGFYTLSVYGAGSALASGSTATITGAASATEGSPNTVEVTVAGTVNVTVTGALDRFQLEGGSIETPHIITTSATVTRDADVTTVPTPNVLTTQKGAVEIVATSALTSTAAHFVLFSGDTPVTELDILSSGGQFILRKNTIGAAFVYALVAENEFRVQIYWDDVIGYGIRVADSGDDITAVAFQTVANTDDMPFNDVLEIGARTGASLFIGEFDNDGVPVCYSSASDAGWL